MASWGVFSIGQAHFVDALVVAFDDQVGNDVVGVLDLERAARPQIQPFAGARASP